MHPVVAHYHTFILFQNVMLTITPINPAYICITCQELIPFLNMNVQVHILFLQHSCALYLFQIKAVTLQ